jgi:hypothetical protein
VRSGRERARARVLAEAWLEPADRLGDGVPLLAWDTALKDVLVKAHRERRPLPPALRHRVTLERVRGELDRRLRVRLEHELVRGQEGPERVGDLLGVIAA